VVCRPTLFTFFYVFFKIQKTSLFTYFWVVAHVFSNTATRQKASWYRQTDRQTDDRQIPSKASIKGSFGRLAKKRVYTDRQTDRRQINPVQGLKQGLIWTTRQKASWHRQTDKQADRQTTDKCPTRPQIRTHLDHSPKGKLTQKDRQTDRQTTDRETDRRQRNPLPGLK